VNKPGRKSFFILLFLGILFFLPSDMSAQNPIPKIIFGVEESETPEDFVLSLQIVMLITILSLSPSIIIMMTSFTRITITFHFLRTAMGTQQIPSNQILVGLALFITFFIMQPVLAQINETALQPYLNEEISQADALGRAAVPIKAFMLKQTREKDLELFIKLRNEGRPASPDELSLWIIIPAYVISEINIAFQIGFLLYLPMLLIDLVVASVLLSMGMMMLPPIMISMPFKILLFVMVDGWYLIIDSLVRGFK